MGDTGGTCGRGSGELRPEVQEWWREEEAATVREDSGVPKHETSAECPVLAPVCLEKKKESSSKIGLSSLGKVRFFPNCHQSEEDWGRGRGDKSFHTPLPSMMDDVSPEAALKASVLSLGSDPGCLGAWAAMSDREGTRNQSCVGFPAPAVVF